PAMTASPARLTRPTSNGGPPSHFGVTPCAGRSLLPGTPDVGPAFRPWGVASSVPGRTAGLGARPGVDGRLPAPCGGGPSAIPLAEGWFTSGDAGGKAGA